MILGFRLKLKDKLKLPVAVEHMLYGDVCLTDANFDAAYHDVTTVCTDEALEEFLKTWDGWATVQRKMNLPRFADLTVKEVEKIEDCIIIGTITEQMVTLSNAHMDFESLCEWYIRTGTDMARQPLNWKNVERLKLKESEGLAYVSAQALIC